MNSVKLPYFDYLLGKLAEDDAVLAQTFGRHVHWGYWETPGAARISVAEFARAAEELSRQLCLAGSLGDGMAVLDAGCGFGGTLAHINENHQGMRLVGLNLDGRQLVRAKEQGRPLRNNRIELIRANACLLPLAGQAFDLVMAVECIFHFPSRQQFFQEAFRVLRPGGCLVLSDFVCHPLIQPFTKLKTATMLGAGFYGHCNLQFTAKDYEKLASASGFAIKSVRDINAQTLPTYDFLRYLSRSHRPGNPFALLETAAAECLSRVGLLKYYLLSFTKP